jgi:hypothetical protein
MIMHCIHHNSTGTLIALLFAGVSFCQAEPALRWSAQSQDIDTVSRMQNISHAFTYHNTGDSAVVIRSIDTDCGCTVQASHADTVPPGDTGTIEISFTTSRFEGPLRFRTFVHTDQSTDTLKLSGVVARNVAIEPPVLDVKRVFRGDSVPGAAVIRWNRPERPSFSVQGYGKHIAHAAVERAGDLSVVTVTVLPETDKGYFSDTVNIATGSEQWPELSLVVKGDVVGACAATPSYIQFGQIDSRVRSRARIMLTYKKSGPCPISRIESEPSFCVAAESAFRTQQQIVTVTIFPGAPKGRFKGAVKMYISGSDEAEIVVPVSGFIR